jgi:hypothetical protein
MCAPAEFPHPRLRWYTLIALGVSAVAEISLQAGLILYF